MTILPLVFAATVGAFALTSALTAQQPAPAEPAKAAQGGEKVDIRRSQEDNLKLYKKFAEETLRLAQRWEKSDDLNERDRAKALRAALKLIEERGGTVAFHDPHVPAVPPTREHAELSGRASTALTGETLAGFDAVLINTAIARARDPVGMAEAFSAAVEAGVRAYHAGPMETREMAQPSTPVIGKAFLT